MTADPGPGSNGFPLPPAVTPPPGQLYGPPSYGAVPYGPPPGWPPQYGQQAGYGPYGPVQGQFVQPGMLAAAADRERTMDVLKAAYTEGRLTKSEFDDRAAQVLAARTYADLHGLVTDLPNGPGAPAMAMPVPYPAGYYPAPMMPRTNGFAVGALICGLVPFFGGIPAVIFGHVARGQIKHTGERGDGVAVAGLVLGYLWIAIWMLVILVSIANS